ncbi:putative Ig domain-containing protein [Burkholderia ubonensis]|uniref:putative Ig domain-containing protein n=1 Tax=Burkholderia ubonensis TaxID=101571 RepID=UPI00076D8760|nr:putative Ig domain-containing protein [Burkholderia ubonensis]KVP65618.1 hypothetical protein WJ93_24160 [Burkholderia ubonensis]
MKKNSILVAALTLASFSAAAADYYVVVPVPNRTPAADISVSLGAYTLPEAVAGAPYAGFDFKNVLQVTGDASFRPGYVKWSLASGSLPQGLTLNGDGTLLGTPANAGTSTFAVRATYKTKAGEQAYQVISVAIAVRLASSTPPQGEIGKTYAYDLKKLLTVSGDSTYTGSGSGVTWTVVASSLPAGLHLTNDGFIGGTPTAPGTGSLVARATYRGTNGEQTYQVVVPDITVALASATLPDALIATPYPGYNLNSLLTVSGDSTFDKSGVNWSLVSGSLPAGLTLNADGTIAGTPSAAGSVSFTVQAAYRTKTGQHVYSLYVGDITVALNTATLPAGSAGNAYAGFNFNSVLQVTGDSKVVSSDIGWSVVGGILPAGLTLNSNGTLSGTPTAATSGSAIQVKATYKTKSAQQGYSVTVGAGLALQAGGYRTWADGALAASCNDYLKPSAPYSYSGATGDGLYRVLVNGSTYDVRCDMTTDGGGWMLLGNQVSGSIFPSNTTTDVGTPSGNTATTWRYGNAKVQALQAKQAYRLNSLNPSTGARVDTIYFSGSCVINYTDTWNQASNVNSMPAACRTAYTSAAMTNVVPNAGATVSASGIGTNNSGQYCSMRFANAVSSGFNSGAFDCNMQQANTMQLWGR